MNRCNTLRPAHPRRWWLAALCAAAACTAAPSFAQVAQGRNFPPAALRGTLTVENPATATLNGQPIRLAPGLRLFGPQNSLVMAHTLQGKSVTVNYMTEASTGWLLTAWILTPAEAAQPRKGSDATATNIRTEADAQPALR
ncbi:hypothetical protein [Diaphorobacter sp.]|uniref:hypothetical protein n=1 Tax=Diaphorobacter sp. TaxID=1934310 RepID=UPI003D0DCF73